MPRTDADQGDFFEEDEPVEDVLAAFESGRDKGVTGPFAGLALVGLSGNTGAVVGGSGNQVGWLVTDAQAVANTAKPPVSLAG